MATKTEIQRHIAGKLRRLQETKRLNGGFVESSILENITRNDWDVIAGWIQTNDFQSIGKHIASIVRNQIVDDSMREAAAIVSDDVLSLDEYSRVEGLP